MRLEQLYENFGRSSHEQQLAYLVVYRQRRAEDMSKAVPARNKKKSSAKKSNVDLSDDEKDVMKMLGLKPKDIIALRAMTTQTEETVEDETALLTDSTFEEGDEDEPT